MHKTFFNLSLSAEMIVKLLWIVSTALIVKLIFVEQTVPVEKTFMGTSIDRQLKRYLLTFVMNKTDLL